MNTRSRSRLEEMVNTMELTSEDLDQAFKEWRERHETKFIISLLPGFENNQAYEALLRSVFDAGMANGRGMVVHKLLAMLMGRMQEKIDPQSTKGTSDGVGSRPAGETDTQHTSSESGDARPDHASDG